MEVTNGKGVIQHNWSSRLRDRDEGLLVMNTSEPLLVEFQETLKKASAARRSAMLRDITALFADNSAGLSDDLLDVFDQIMTAIVGGADRDTLQELSKQLAGLTKTPLKLSVMLASNPEIQVSGAMLQAAPLPPPILAKIATTAGPQHLAAIASRQDIDDSVTDILIERGNADLGRKLAANNLARISHVGFVKLLNAAKRDTALAKLIAARSDLPEELKPFIDMLNGTSTTAPANGAQSAA